MTSREGQGGLLLLLAPLLLLLGVLSTSATSAQAATLDVPCTTTTAGSCDAKPLHSAVAAAKAGDIVVVAAGRYRLQKQLRISLTSTPTQPFTLRGAGPTTILDAGDLHLDAPPATGPGSTPPFARDNGTVQIEGSQHVVVRDLSVVNSHQQGITVRDSSDVVIEQVSTDFTFASGIGVWDSQNDGHGTERIQIRKCSVRHANQLRLKHPGYDAAEAPHEAVSVGGAVDFVVEDNVVEDGFKEGITIKETSARGLVRRNTVTNMARQGIYAGAWGGALDGLTIVDNVVRDNAGAGIVLGVEDKNAVNQNIRVAKNTVEQNQGTGIWLSRFGDGPQQNIIVESNTVRGNGWGAPDRGDKHFWITGGIWLHSTQLAGVRVSDNDVADNAGFQLGWSVTAARQKDRCAAAVVVEGNRVRGARADGGVFGWGDADRVAVADLDAGSFAGCGR